MNKSPLENVEPYSFDDLQIPIRNFPANPTGRWDDLSEKCIDAIKKSVRQYIREFNNKQPLPSRVTSLQMDYAERLLTLYIRTVDRHDRLEGAPLHFSINRFTAASKVRGRVAETHFNWLVSLQSSGLIKADNNSLDYINQAVCQNISLRFDPEFISRFQTTYNRLFRH